MVIRITLGPHAGSLLHDSVPLTTSAQYGRNLNGQTIFYVAGVASLPPPPAVSEQPTFDHLFRPLFQRRKFSTLWPIAQLFDTL